MSDADVLARMEEDLTGGPAPASVRLLDATVLVLMAAVVLAWTGVLVCLCARFPTWALWTAGVTVAALATHEVTRYCQRR
jgi:hypothetical protein